MISWHLKVLGEAMRKGVALKLYIMYRVFKSLKRDKSLIYFLCRSIQIKWNEMICSDLGTELHCRSHFQWKNNNSEIEI